MKQLLRSKKSRIVVGVAIAVAAAGVVGWVLWTQQQAAWARDVIKKTDVGDYSDLSEDDLNNRSKAIFGKSVDDLAKSDIKNSDGAANAKEAGMILAAGGKTDESINAFKEAEVRQGDKVDQDLYRNYRNALDEAGRHDEATDLLRRELELLKKENPPDQVAIWRIESQITEREGYYK